MAAFSWSEPSNGRNVDTHLGSFYVVERGPELHASRGVVVLVNGFGDYHYCFLRMVDFLGRRGFRAIAFDWLNHGQYSSISTRPFTGDYFVEMLETVVAAVGVPSEMAIGVVGHSMGGLISSMYARKNPNKVAWLVLLASAGLMRRNFQLFFAERAPAWLVASAFGSLESQKKIWADCVAKKNRGMDFFGEMIRRLETQFKRVQPGRSRPVVVDAMISIVRHFPLTKKNPRNIECLREVGAHGRPVLIVWGNADIIVPPDCVERFKRYFKSARFEILDGAGHVSFEERAAEFDAIFESFLATVPPLR